MVFKFLYCPETDSVIHPSRAVIGTILIFRSMTIISQIIFLGLQYAEINLKTGSYLIILVEKLD